MDVPLVGIVTGNVVVVVIPDANCTDSKVGVAEVLVLAVTVVENVSPGEMVNRLGDAVTVK